MDINNVRQHLPHSFAQPDVAAWLSLKSKLSFIDNLYDMTDKPEARQHHLWTAAIILTSVCTAYTVLLMTTAQQEKEKANWNEAEMAAFLAYLLDHKSEIGDSGSFKASTYNAVAGHISHLLTLDPVKTGKMCKTKWQTV
jgi:hypothetical protein